MSNKSTLKSISEKLNLSISTVSRALKNHPDISETTKRKVKELADLMEYEPNAYAVNLRTNNSKVIGLVVPYISNFFYESFIAAVEEEARNAGYTLMVLQTGNDKSIENESLKLCRQNRVAGILICMAANSTDTQAYLNFFDLKTPIIFFDNVPIGDAFNRVCLSDEEAAIIAASEIIKHDRKNVLAIFGNPDLSITKNRQPAFEKKLSAASPQPSVKIEYASSSAEAGQVISNYFKKGNTIDQVFCMSDEILIGAMKKINELKISVPGKTGLISLSNGVLPTLFNPAVTYVETSGFKLGKLAISRMFEHFNGQTFIRTIYQPSILVPGNSM